MSPREGVELLMNMQTTRIEPVGKPDWRPGQEEVAQRVVDYLNEEDRPVGLRAPTGTGKSMISVSLARHLPGKSVILTGTHQLQQQYLDDFPHVVDFRGKDNYRCPLMDNRESEVRACSETATTPACHYRSEGRCDYYAKLKQALSAEVVITNYANFLTLHYLNWKVDNLFLDEAHNLAEVLGDCGKLDLSNLTMENLGLPTYSEGRASTMIPEEWVEYVDELHDAVTEVVDTYEDRNLRELTPDEAKHYQRMVNMGRRLENAPIKEDDLEFWVDPTGPSRPGTFVPTWTSVRLQPLYPELLARNLLFTRGKRVVLMSATLPENDELYGLVEASSTFDPTRSPIYVHPQPAIKARDWALKSDVVQQLVSAVDEGVERFWDQRHLRSLIVVASHAQVRSFMEMSRLSSHLVGISTSGLDKKALLEMYLTSEDYMGLVVGSEMCTGLDLPGDLASVTFLLKGPWRIPANVRQGDRPNWLYRRNQVDPTYIPMQAAIWFAQMVGRATRSVEDVNPVYVFDSSWWGAHYRRMACWLPREVQDRVEAGRRG